MPAEHSSETEFTDIDLADIHSKNGNSTQPAGPWTHSTNSYSRKVHQPLPESGNKISRKHLSVSILALIIIFIVGVALGVVIGHYGIQKDQSTSSKQYAQREVTDSPTVTCSCPQTSTHQPSIASSTAPQCNVCSSRNPDISSGDEYITSPFAPLSVKEMRLVSAVMLTRGYASKSETLMDNTISHVYLFPQEKGRVLDYLDNSGSFPGRYAMVHVARGARDPPDVMEYKVGPLNETGDNITVETLRQDNEITFNQRTFEVRELILMQRELDHHLKDLNDLLSESFDGALYPTSVYPTFYPLPSTNSTDRLSGMYLYMYEPGTTTLRILPVTCRVHHPGNDSSKWDVTEFYYLNQGPFTSGAKLMEAYSNDTLRKIQFPKGYWNTHYGEYNLRLNRSEPPRPFSEIPPPQTYEPEGPRYTINGHRVAWMGWQFEFSSNPIRGPGLYDIRFKGQRIAYEISLQDITLIYSSPSNGAGPPAISDTVFRLGTYNEPRYGVDCPRRGSILYSSKFSLLSPSSKRAACVFEANGQEALWRHERKGLEDNYLVIRAAMNLGNYDYTAEWRFHLDGSLETKLTASGYLYGAFWDPDDPWVNGSKSATPFGHRISDYMLGPIHDHNYVFKVDLDILGTNNSFETIHWRTGSTLEGFQSQANITEKPGFFYFNHTRYLEHELLEHEQSFVSNPFKPKYFTVVNENENNFWGMKRGYRVIPHAAVAESMPEHLMFDTWGQLQRQISVTKRKDSEQYATESWYGLQQPTLPGNGITHILNNETVRNTDLVLWVSEKFYHAPTAEDLPMTLSVHNGFTLKPHNYFDRTPVFDVPSHYSSFAEPYVIEPCYDIPLT